MSGRKVSGRNKKERRRTSWADRATLGISYIFYNKVLQYRIMPNFYQFVKKSKFRTEQIIDNVNPRAAPNY